MVAIAVRQNLEDFQSSHGVFDTDSLALLFFVGLLLFAGQLSFTRLLGRQTNTNKQLIHALITRIRITRCGVRQAQFAFLQQTKVGRFSCCETSRHDFLGAMIYQDLGFDAVTSFLAAVMLALFFFGRSMGVSVVSMT